MSTARTTDDTFTHVLRLSDGTTITYRADHGRLYCAVKPAGSRYESTYPVEFDAALNHASRLSEVVAAIPATRRSA